MIVREPFVGQDDWSWCLLSLVKQLNQALGLTSLVVSHDLQETLSITDHVIMMQTIGRISGFTRCDAGIG